MVERLQDVQPFDIAFGYANGVLTTDRGEAGFVRQIITDIETLRVNLHKYVDEMIYREIEDAKASKENIPQRMQRCANEVLDGVQLLNGLRALDGALNSDEEFDKYVTEKADTKRPASAVVSNVRRHFDPIYSRPKVKYASNSCEAQYLD